jgi:alpha-glucosidase
MFLAGQPDLNWSNPEVEAAMAEVLRFWLDRGADGFRIDVVHAIGKDPRLADLPEDQAWIPICALHDNPATHAILARLRRVVDEWGDPPRVMIGETVLPTVDQIAPYYGTAESPELALAFNFHPLRSRWAAPSWRRRISDAERLFNGAGRWPTWVLSNHDNPRHRTRFDGSEAKARAAAVALLTLRGTPFLYAGEELGLEDAVVPPPRRVDPAHPRPRLGGRARRLAALAARSRPGPQRR